MKITGNNMKFLKPLILFLLISISFTSCKDDPVPTPDPDDSKPKASALTLKINQFIKDVMTDVYLWYKTMPTIDIKYELSN